MSIISIGSNNKLPKSIISHGKEIFIRSSEKVNKDYRTFLFTAVDLIMDV